MSIPGLPDMSVATKALSADMDSLTAKAGSGCDIFGTLGTMVSADTKAMFAAIQKGITDAMAKIGAVMKGITDMIAGVMDRVKGFIAKIGELASAAIAKINAVIAKIGVMITAAIGKLKAVIAGVIGVINDMAAVLGKAVRAIVAAGCSMVKSAASAIGGGVSDMIDSVTSEDPFPAEASIKAAADKALGSVGASNLSLGQSGFDPSVLGELDSI
jgi:phage-related protein